jgi:uncharacterized protein (DUF488 family)
MNTNYPEDQDFIFTIGHSNHSTETFIKLLSEAEIQVLVDVRSHPTSKFASQFDTKQLKKDLVTNGFKYLFMGVELGGRPKGEEFYDDDGHVIYSLVATTSLFLQGIDRLEKGIQSYRVAIMCSEENPLDCHRRLLVGRVLRHRGIILYHIRGDGTIQTEEDLESEDRQRFVGDSQLSFFNKEEVTPWRSTRSVLPRKQQRNSSNS